MYLRRVYHLIRTRQRNTRIDGAVEGHAYDREGNMPDIRKDHVEDERENAVVRRTGIW